jgi:methionyl-tRNA formyltransferase
MKFAFVTCVQIGLSCMEAIYSVNGKLDLIMTIPDEKSKNKSGRIYIDDFAKKHDIPVVKINHINDKEAIEALKLFDIDWLFLIGWSQIATSNLIETPKEGVIGAHPTLLPEGRGRAAIPWAIIKGNDKTGVTFFMMDEGVDTGMILGQEIVHIDNGETATSLYQKINQAHEILIKKLYFNLKNRTVMGIVQDDSKATYWEGRTPDDGKIASNMSIEEADRLVRATTTPYPGAFILKDKHKIIIWGGIAYKNKTFISGSYEIILNNGFFYATKFDVIELD